MSSVTLPQASAGAALFGRVVSDASRPFPPQERPRSRVPVCRQCDRGGFVQGRKEEFCGAERCPKAPCLILCKQGVARYRPVCWALDPKKKRNRLGPLKT